MTHVFISYAWSDGSLIATRLHDGFDALDDWHRQARRAANCSVDVFSQSRNPLPVVVV
jgi:hypothetical protein